MLKKYSKIIILIAVIASVKGCGIFETRTPQQPVTVRSTYVPPTSPDLLITNLQYSIQEKNSDNYSKCISQAPYLYVPDSRSQQIYGTIFQNWTPVSEKNYLNNLISQTDADATSALFLDNAVTTTITPDSVIYQADYIIVFQHNRANVPKSAIGNLTLTLRANENNLFYINKWEDFRRHDTDFTWSELKANFSN